MKPLITIVGPTASGKTSLSITLAQRYDGEIISADSRQVYRGLDIGTDKITPGERASITHHLIDVCDPEQVYTVADFVRDGRRALDTIAKHNHLPIIVGGSFFYIDALLGNVSLPEVPPNNALRESLESHTPEELHTILKSKDPTRAAQIDTRNPRRLIRALEIVEAMGAVPLPAPAPLPYRILKIGLTATPTERRARIIARLRKHVEEGLIDEVAKLKTKGISHARMSELGLEYRYISEYLDQKSDYETLVHTLETKLVQYAKRQMTWLKRDSDIMWFQPTDTKNIFLTVDAFLNSDAHTAT